MTVYPGVVAYIPWQGTAVYDGNVPEYIVIHVGQGWVGTWNNWARTGYPHASFHFGVGLDGGVYQYLPLDKGGAHAGGASAVLHPDLLPWTANIRSIGIEHEGFSSGEIGGSPTGQWNDEQLKASASLVRWLCETLNIPKTRERIIGHYQIATDRANDPGPLFPWDRYMELIQEDDMTEDRVREIIREELGWGQAPPETTLAGLNRWGNKLEAEQVVPWISALKLHMATPHTSGPVPPHPHAVTVTLD